ncbi:helix-turn-helix domain-containing protein [Chryseobacterium sp. SIMBA_029]|uniref:helix-turn-helix domain-containing protein n=1 Tax=Chryseobacterium sp. SIMBA_029 TaxID=3085772 RepID=UPI0039791195
MVHFHLITGSLFSFFIMLNMWKYSTASCMWLIPIPLAAYIFFSKKISYIYSGYVIALILIVNLVEKNLQLDYFRFSRKGDLVISDSTVFVLNIFIFLLLLYYNEKIKKAEELAMSSLKNNLSPLENSDPQKIKNQEVKDTIQKEIKEEFKINTLKDDHFSFVRTDSQKIKDPEQKCTSQKEIEKYSLLFQRMKEMMERENHFKDADFSISQLSFILKTNNLYISNAIKQNKYNSFNHFINSYRVNSAKQLMSQNDFDKVTLMYIYTQCGFSNQSTFNRAFKMIEGITPSEFIKKTKKNNISLRSPI